MTDEKKNSLPPRNEGHGEACDCPACSGEIPAEVLEDLEWVDEGLDPTLMGLVDEALEENLPHRVALLANTLVLNGVGLLQQMIGEEATAGFLKEVVGAVEAGEFESPLVLDLEEDDEDDD